MQKLAWAGRPSRSAVVRSSSSTLTGFPSSLERAEARGPLLGASSARPPRRRRRAARPRPRCRRGAGVVVDEKRRGRDGSSAGCGRGSARAVAGTLPLGPAGQTNAKRRRADAGRPRERKRTLKFRPAPIPIVEQMRAIRARGDLEAELAAARGRISALEAELAQRRLTRPARGFAPDPARRSAPSSSSTSAARSATGAPSRSRCSTSTASARSTPRRGYAAGDELLATVGAAIERADPRPRPRLPDRRRRVRDPARRDPLRRGAAGARAPAARARGHRGRIGPRALGVGRGRRLSVAVSPRRTPRSGRARRSRPRAPPAAAASPSVRAPSARTTATPAQTDVVAALASALEERDHYTGEHSESVVEMPAGSPSRLAVDAGRDRADPHGRAASRHRQGRDPRRDPPQARPARRPRVGDHARASRRSASGSCARSPAWARSRAWSATSTSAGTAAATPTASPATRSRSAARIILACDAYHAMISDRPYRKAMSHTDAMAELTRQRRHPVRPRGRAGARRLPLRPPPVGLATV